MVSDKSFNTDGSQRIFSSDFEVISEDHLRVFLDGVVQSRDDYDLINNAAVFHTAPTTGQALILQVGTTPGDILSAPTDAGIVALNIADVNTVANDIDNVNTVATNITDVNTIATNIAELLLADDNAAAAAASAAAALVSENNAATSETNAATSATNASASETAAQAAQTATEALFDQFGDQYLGSHSSDPTTDNDGDPLNDGDIYWNTTDNVLKFYTGTAWVAPEDIATTAANNAQASATAAATSETNAATSETNAAASASAASTSETNAGTSATNAAASETAASTSATNAATSETNAAASESAASTSATNAGVSETNAATSASSAATSATNAATSETNAATSETNAATSETNAASSATAAATSESNAATSETNAATSATNAATSETNAAASATSAQAALDSINGTYLGAQTSDPSVDLNGNAVTAGDWYFNTTNSVTRIYDGSAWQNGAVSTTNFVQKTGDTMTGTLTATDFIGPLNGPVRFTAKNDEGTTITKGQVVYIKGVSGEQPTVGLADANDNSKMPAFGLVYADTNNNAEVEVVTFGSLYEMDTSSFSLGDTLYVSTTPGALTSSAPAGESASIQNIGKVQRVHASAGIIKVGGAGRSNATPNLNNGNVFIGDSNNQATSRALQISDTTGLQTALDGKSDTTHNHDAAYAPISHTHAISEVTNLQTELDGKSDTTHNHDADYDAAGTGVAMAIALG